MNIYFRPLFDRDRLSELRGDNAFRMDSCGLNATGDRPIGIKAVPDGNNNAGGLFDRVIVLTQKKIEDALAAPAKIPNMPVGTMGTLQTRGHYYRYARERSVRRPGDSDDYSYLPKRGSANLFSR
jgi:hypothetical protein